MTPPPPETEVLITEVPVDGPAPTNHGRTSILGAVVGCAAVLLILQLPGHDGAGSNVWMAAWIPAALGLVLLAVPGVLRRFALGLTASGVLLATMPIASWLIGR